MGATKDMWYALIFCLSHFPPPPLLLLLLLSFLPSSHHQPTHHHTPSPSLSCLTQPLLPLSHPLSPMRRTKGPPPRWWHTRRKSNKYRIRKIIYSMAVAYTRKFHQQLKHLGGVWFACFLFSFSVKIENRHKNMFGLTLLKIFTWKCFHKSSQIWKCHFHVFSVFLYMCWKYFHLKTRWHTGK